MPTSDSSTEMLMEIPSEPSPNTNENNSSASAPNEVVNEVGDGTKSLDVASCDQRSQANSPNRKDSIESASLKNDSDDELISSPSTPLTVPRASPLRARLETSGTQSSSGNCSPQQDELFERVLEEVMRTGTPPDHVSSVGSVCIEDTTADPSSPKRLSSPKPNRIPDFGDIMREMMPEIMNTAQNICSRVKNNEAPDFSKIFNELTKQSRETKKTNWLAVWTSKANGCRAYEPFAAQLTSLQTANPTMNRFEINKQLKEWANSNGQYTAWQDWARARLVAEGKPVPVDKAHADEATEATLTDPPQVSAKSPTSYQQETSNILDSPGFKNLLGDLLPKLVSNSPTKPSNEQGQASEILNLLKIGLSDVNLFEEGSPLSMLTKLKGILPENVSLSTCLILVLLAFVLGYFIQRGVSRPNVERIDSSIPQEPALNNHRHSFDVNDLPSGNYTRPSRTTALPQRPVNTPHSVRFVERPIRTRKMNAASQTPSTFKSGTGSRIDDQILGSWSGLSNFPQMSVSHIEDLHQRSEGNHAPSRVTPSRVTSSRVTPSRVTSSRVTPSRVTPSRVTCCPHSRIGISALERDVMGNQEGEDLFLLDLLSLLEPIACRSSGPRCDHGPRRYRSSTPSRTRPLCPTRSNPTCSNIRLAEPEGKHYSFYPSRELAEEGEDIYWIEI